MLWFTSCKFKSNSKDAPFESITAVWFNIVWNELQYSLLYSPFCYCRVRHISLGYILANQRVRMNGPISNGVSSALARAFSGRSAILKIVEEMTLGTRLNLRACKEVQLDKKFPSLREGVWGKTWMELWTELLGCERITGRFEVRRTYKYSAESTAQYPWVLRGVSKGKLC